VRWITDQCAHCRYEGCKHHFARAVSRSMFAIEIMADFMVLSGREGLVLELNVRDSSERVRP
jgi:hypothetical protein